MKNTTSCLNQENINISIIIPVYNVDKYVGKCIESILNQNYTNYELLLVDDGSTDNSFDIISSYKSNKVKVFKKNNGGPSSARNLGIDKSKGRYLMFMDADDFLYDDSSLSALGKAIENNSTDIILYRMALYYERNNKYVYERNMIDDSKHEVISFLSAQNKNGRVSPSPCDKIIRSKIVKDNEVYFEEGILCEDVMWSNKLYLCCNTISAIDKVIYVYRQQRFGSTMTSRSKKTSTDLFYIINYWLNYNYKDANTQNLYFNMLSFWYLILRTTFNEEYFDADMMDEFPRLNMLIANYHDNYKVDLAYKVSRLIGIEKTIKLMKVYVSLKDKGIIKL